MELSIPSTLFEKNYFIKLYIDISIIVVYNYIRRKIKMKNIKIILTTIVISFIILTLAIVYITRVQKFSKEAYLKDIYSNNHESVKIVVLDILNVETSHILNEHEVNLFLNTLKEENIKYEFYRTDKTLMGDKIKFRIYYDEKSVDVSITSNSVSINGKRYITENNFINLIQDIINNHSTYYYN